MDGLLGHKGHLVRVAILFAGGIVVFLVLQSLFVPEGFGVYGHYRAGAIEDNQNSELVHAGYRACIECHGDARDALDRGKHRQVRCEACHGPLGKHSLDPATAAAVRPDPKALCERCHQENVARPAGFPQVDAAAHSGGEACTTCHRAHDPLGAEATASRSASGATEGAEL